MKAKNIKNNCMIKYVSIILNINKNDKNRSASGVF